jgi:hypothetical protein
VKESDGSTPSGQPAPRSGFRRRRRAARSVINLVLRSLPALATGLLVRRSRGRGHAAPTERARPTLPPATPPESPVASPVEPTEGPAKLNRVGPLEQWARRHFKEQPFAVAVALLAVAFAWLWLSSAMFYWPLGVSPHEVGISYPALLAQSAVGFLALFALASVVVGAMLGAGWLLSWPLPDGERLLIGCPARRSELLSPGSPSALTSTVSSCTRGRLGSWRRA